MAYKEIFYIENVDELRSRRGSGTTESIAVVTGLTDLSGDGTYFYRWFDSLTNPDNGISIIAPTVGATTDGRWARVNSSITVRDFKVGINTNNPVTDLAVSNNGAEGFEVLLIRDVEKRVVLLTYDRALNEYTPMYFSASDFVFNKPVKGADATLPNEFVTLGQSNRSIIDDSITSMPTAASLDSAYPSVPLPYYVIAKNISSGASPTIFIKHSPGVWLFQPLAVLT